LLLTQRPGSLMLESSMERTPNAVKTIFAFVALFELR
jgi:hypothetical protein